MSRMLLLVGLLLLVVGCGGSDGGVDGAALSDGVPVVGTAGSDVPDPGTAGPDVRDPDVPDPGTAGPDVSDPDVPEPDVLADPSATWEGGWFTNVAWDPVDVTVALPAAALHVHRYSRGPAAPADSGQLFGAPDGFEFVHVDVELVDRPYRPGGYQASVSTPVDRVRLDRGPVGFVDVPVHPLRPTTFTALVPEGHVPLLHLETSVGSAVLDPSGETAAESQAALVQQVDAPVAEDEVTVRAGSSPARFRGAVSEAVVSPWVDQLGWADPDHVWVVAQFTSWVTYPTYACDVSAVSAEFGRLFDIDGVDVAVGAHGHGRSWVAFLAPAEVSGGSLWLELTPTWRFVCRDQVVEHTWDGPTFEVVLHG